MRKIPQFLSILILTLGFAVAPALAEATVPTEVERVKDHYYFKIHGGPWTPYPDYGKAEFIYKNLSTGTQSVNVIIQVTWHGEEMEPWEFPRVLGPGEEWSGCAPEDFGVTVNFWLYVDGVLAFSGTIWVPPPQSS